MCIFNYKKRTHNSEILILGEGYSDDVLVTYSHGGSPSGSTPDKIWVIIK